MKNDILLYKKGVVDNYSKLLAYDENENNGRKYQAIGANFESQTYEQLRFKSGLYDSCIFNNCIFKAVGLSGTHFISCKLYDFEIIDSNLQFCDFSKETELKGVHKTPIIYSSNLSQSMFHDLAIENIQFKSTTISQARFINTSFHNVTWESCTLQDNIFENVTMKDISLVGCNLEYSDFRNVKFKNSVLPLHQIPYTYGLLECLKESPNEIKINAISSECEPLTAEEYLSLLPELSSYYISMNEYFPAINIELFLENYEQSKKLIDIGAKHYIHINDFRKIKGLCKLIAAHPYFDKHFMRQLYFDLVEYYNAKDVSDYEKYQYSLHIYEIKRILTDFDDSEPTAQLYLKTNITSLDIEKVGVFYRFIEECLGYSEISTEEYSVEIRHNSNPLSFWITLSQCDPARIIRAIGIIMSVVSSNPEFLQTAISTIANITTIGSFALQISQASKSKERAVTCPDVTAPDIKYIKEKNHLLESKEISVQISLPFFSFNYQKKKQCES